MKIGQNDGFNAYFVVLNFIFDFGHFWPCDRKIQFFVENVRFSHFFSLSDVKKWYFIAFLANQFFFTIFYSLLPTK